jgi:catechol 2,3-dioxygenase-like lactoylglutathione lyase family enzyme
VAGRRPSRPRARARKPGRSTPARARRRAPARTKRAAAPSNAIGAVTQHLSYTSHDLDGVRRFYTRTLGFRPASVEPHHGYLWVETAPGASLGFMAPLPGPPEQWRPPREPSIHLVVRDVNRAHRLLSARGVTFQQPPTDMAWGYRTAVLRDPDGRLVCLVQPIASRPARPSRRKA